MSFLLPCRPRQVARNGRPAPVAKNEFGAAAAKRKPAAAAALNRPAAASSKKIPAAAASLKRPASAAAMKRPAAVASLKRPAAAAAMKRPAAAAAKKNRTLSAGSKCKAAVVARPEDVPQFAASAAAKARRRRLYRAMQDRPAVAMLIGDAIGDAFGFGIEMQDAYWIRSCIVNFARWPQNPVVIPKFRENNTRGFYSDDAQMTVGLMKALMRHGASAVDADKMFGAWAEEWDLDKHRPPPAVHGEGRQGHGGFKYVMDGKTTLEEMRAGQARREDPGNAPPMRALPLAFVADAAERERLCAENADSTHPHPRARAASFLIAAAGRHLLAEGGSAATALGAAREALQKSACRDAATEAHLAKVAALPDYHEYGDRFVTMPLDVLSLLCGDQPRASLARVPGGADGKSRVNGLDADAMRTAVVVLYLIRWHRGPLDVLKASVDIGGDVDSIAALCLGLVGASSGLAFGEDGGLPWSLLEELEGVEYLVEQAKAFDAWCHKQT